MGGLNEKIEGFWRVVRTMDYPGEPGVIIPRACLPELMLNRELVTAIEEKRFRVYAIDTIDEGLEILTGEMIGRPDESGNYPEGSLHRLVQERLDQLAEGLSQWRRGSA